MAPLPPLPEDLKHRLLAAGVKDETTLYAVLEADPQLSDEYHRWLYTHAIQVVAEAEDRPALEALAEKLPMVLGQSFFEALEKAIQTALDRGEYGVAEALQQRLDALKEIQALRAEEQRTPLAQALMAFVQARHDEGARRAFEQHRRLLDSDEAEALLKQGFEGSSEEAERHLQSRRALLRRLRRGG